MQRTDQNTGPPERNRVRQQIAAAEFVADAVRGADLPRAAEIAVVKRRDDRVAADFVVTPVDFPIAFFLEPSQEASGDNLFFRSMQSATKSSRLRGLRRYEWLKGITNYLSEFVVLPHVQFPGWDMPNRVEELEPNFIEKLASRVRAYWSLGDGPISDVTLLAENKGIVVSRISLGSTALDAYSGWCKAAERPYLILSSDKDSSLRSRYDVAHELGHLILHREIGAVSINNRATHRLVEAQAHRFASAFLVPAQPFADDLYVPTLDALRVLQNKWRVSVAMLVYRVQELDLVSEEQGKRLWINCTRRGWRTNDPLDSKLHPEEPRVLRRAFQLLVEKRIQSRDQIKSSIPLNVSDIEELANLPFGYLDEDSPYIWAPDPRPSLN